MNHRSPRRVVAVYGTLDNARRAMSSVEMHGLDAVELEMVGNAVSRAAGATNVHRRDRRVVSHVSRRVVGGGALGGVIGAGIGVAVAVAGTSGPIAGFVIVGLLLGSIVGGALAGYASLGANTAWELTFEPDDPGAVAVVVRSSDPDMLDRAADALSATEPIRLERR